MAGQEQCTGSKRHQDMLATWNGRTNGFWIDVHGHLAHIGLELEMSPGVTQSTVCTGVRAIVRTLHTGVPTVFGTGRLCTPVAVEVVSSDGRTWRGKLCKAGRTLTWKCRTHGIGGQSWHRPDSAPPPIDGSPQPRIHAGSTSGTPAANEIECARKIATETINDADAAALEEYLLAVQDEAEWTSSGVRTRGTRHRRTIKALSHASLMQANATELGVWLAPETVDFGVQVGPQPKY